MMPPDETYQQKANNTCGSVDGVNRGLAAGEGDERTARRRTYNRGELETAGAPGDRPGTALTGNQVRQERGNEAGQQIEAEVPVSQDIVGIFPWGVGVDVPSRLRSGAAQIYFSSSGLSMVLVFGGQSFLSVMMACCRA